MISDFSTDRKLLSQKLDEIDAGGATALYDALGYVLADTVKQLRGERTAIVILSDGDDNKSFVPFPAILEAIVESGALIYPLYVPSGLVPELTGNLLPLKFFQGLSLILKVRQMLPDTISAKNPSK